MYQKIMLNKTEKSFCPIGCTINDNNLYVLLCSISGTRGQENGGKTWGYEAAQLTRSLKTCRKNSLEKFRWKNCEFINTLTILSERKMLPCISHDLTTLLP